MNLHIASSFDNANTAQAAAKTVINGRYLSRNRLNARERARLVVDVVAGRVLVDASTLTVGQVTKLCRANRLYVADARDPERRKRLRQLKLQQAWEAVDPNHRAEFCRVVGVDNVWKVLAAAVG